MLSQKTLDALAVNSGIAADVLATAISDEQEQDLELPEGRFLKSDDEAQLLDNHGKQRYDAGRSKALKDAFEGKSKDDFLNEFRASVLEEAEVEPNKKVEDLQKSLTDLQTKYQDDIEAKDLIISEKDSRLKRVETTSQIQAFLPDLIEGIDNNTAITMFNSTHEIKEDGIYRNGQLLKNDLQSPLELKDAVESFISERKWKKGKIQGHGDKKPGNNGAVPKTYAEFQQYCESKGISEGSSEAKEYLKTIKAKNPEFQMD